MQFDMKIYFLMSIFLLAGSSGSLTAQTVSGKVVNTEQQPIDGATIILQTSDSTFVDATISNADGNFVFNHQPEAYRLILSASTISSNTSSGSIIGLPKSIAFSMNFSWTLS